MIFLNLRLQLTEGLSVSVNKGLEGVKSDSRRGSLKPSDSRRGSFQRSRQGSIALGSGERRGSLRSTVAMVTDDPQHKQNVKSALAGAFDDNALSKYNLPLPFTARNHRDRESSVDGNLMF